MKLLKIILYSIFQRLYHFFVFTLANAAANGYLPTYEGSIITDSIANSYIPPAPEAPDAYINPESQELSQYNEQAISLGYLAPESAQELSDLPTEDFPAYGSYENEYVPGTINDLPTYQTKSYRNRIGNGSGYRSRNRFRNRNRSRSRNLRPYHSAIVASSSLSFSSLPPPPPYLPIFRDQFRRSRNFRNSRNTRGRNQRRKNVRLPGYLSHLGDVRRA